MPYEGKFGPLTTTKTGSKKRNPIPNFLKAFNLLRKKQQLFVYALFLFLEQDLKFYADGFIWEISKPKVDHNCAANEEGWDIDIQKTNKKGPLRCKSYTVNIVNGKIILKRPFSETVRTWTSISCFKRTIVKELIKRRRAV